jgi:hypothetical protein
MNWLSFANPLLLAGLAAVALPVLIHYLTRARPRRIAFPPHKFLVEACAGRQAMHRLRAFLLLAARTLAVLALVLLFARPFLKPVSDAAQAEAGKRIVIVIDASFSMRAVQKGTSLFSLAQSEAADVLRGLDSGTEAGIILIGAQPRPLLPALSRNIPALHDELGKARAGFELGDPAAALALAWKMLGNLGTLYVFSDFQQSNWQMASELPDGIVCRLRSVSSTSIENVAVTDVRIVPSEPVVGETAEVVCRILNCTPGPREEIVRLDLGDLSQETRVTIPPFASAEAGFSVSFPQEGPLSGKVTLQPDDLPEDNTRHLAARISKGLRLALVTDSEPRDVRSAAFYIERALAPSERAAPGLTVARRHSQDADRGVLETSDIFILVAPAMLTGESLEIISRRVQDGAQLIVFLDGPNAQALVPAAFNPPFQLLRPVTSETSSQVRITGRALFDGSELDLSSMRFRRHYETRLNADRTDDMLLSFEDGSAALTLSAFGRGSVAFVNLPLTPDGGDFIGNPTFPAILHELLRALRHGLSMPPVSPGAAWTLEVPTTGEGSLAVADPERRNVSIEVLASGRSTRLALPAAEVPGTFMVKQGEVLIATAAVNVDPKESDTRPIALENLKAGENSSVSVIQSGEDLEVGGKPRQLWPELAAAAAGFLALEMLLLSFWRKPSLQRLGAGGREGRTSQNESAASLLEAQR